MKKLVVVELFCVLLLFMGCGGAVDGTGVDMSKDGAVSDTKVAGTEQVKQVGTDTKAEIIGNSKQSDKPDTKADIDEIEKNFTIKDYYLKLPEKYFKDLGWDSMDGIDNGRMNAIEVLDNENYYLKLKDKVQSGGSTVGSMAVFLRTGASDLIALEGGQETDLSFRELVFLTYDHEKNVFVDVTDKVLPEIDFEKILNEMYGPDGENDPHSFYFQLPRYGTDMKVYDTFGDSAGNDVEVMVLKYKNGKFSAVDLFKERSASFGENRLSEIPKSCLDLPENKDLVTKPFQIVGDYGEGAGQATLFGTVTSRREEILGETVERVYFAVQEPAMESTGLKFYNYFKEMVDSGNTVNLGSKAETAIGFALGIIDKDGKFSTTAGVSDGAGKSIMDALNQGETISLTLSVPKYEGSGAPANFSFACMIEL